MAHHLPRKKYLSKLLGDSPDDKNRRTSTSSSVDSTSCETLAPNESSESLIGAIANSTKLGISSEFGSAVFTVDSDGNCSTGELASSGETKDQTNCCEVPNSTDRRVANDEDKVGVTGESSENCRVYFDEGTMDDDDDDNSTAMKSGSDLVEDDATCMNVDSVCYRLQTSQINTADMMQRSSVTLSLIHI